MSSWLPNWFHNFFMNSTVKSVNQRFPSVRNVTTTELATWLQNPQERCVILLDTRPDEEYKISHIEHACRVDYEDTDMSALAAMLEESLAGKPNPTVVCYCSLGYRSSMVARNLQEFYTQSDKNRVPEIYNLAGSLFQWANEKRPMVDSNGEKTHLVHPYSAVFGKLLCAKHRANVEQ